MTGDMTRDRDVRTVTGGGDFTGEILPFVEDMLAQGMHAAMSQTDAGRRR